MALAWGRAIRNGSPSRRPESWQHVSTSTRLRSRLSSDSVALEIARRYLRPDCIVHELTFPMTADKSVLRQSWQQAAGEVGQTLAAGEDCCFITLGDPLLYSTYVYLLRELLLIQPEARIVTVPGVTAPSAAAALVNFPLGQGEQIVTIVPAADDMSGFAHALDSGGTVVLMKIGRRLERVLDELERRGLTDRAVLVSRRHGRPAGGNRPAAAAWYARGNRVSVHPAGPDRAGVGPRSMIP